MYKHIQYIYIHNYIYSTQYNPYLTHTNHRFSQVHPSWTLPLPTTLPWPMQKPLYYLQPETAGFPQRMWETKMEKTSHEICSPRPKMGISAILSNLQHEAMGGLGRVSAHLEYTYKRTVCKNQNKSYRRTLLSCERTSRLVANTSSCDG